ncbi:MULTISPECIES: phosphonate ABC transporter, permease protein PhnE [Burkholderia]|uniref:phosphonate ABC transporter, permease protein PhnE n=1 Tax=Burkholderia TaxID=32008 RepID=UPI00075E8C2F|nr:MULTISPECIES: phosphonate ABC transporter, permease protein PhnE [Burkholderia]KVK73603.1 phosphonate ABC transporter permease [Burkholderia sp. MSMB1498]KWZ48635.1 phosphonate ABC transporter permease [Burkholderia savannae]
MSHTMNHSVRCAPRPGAREARPAALFVAALLGVALFAQACYVVEARPQDLVTGVHGMLDILSRSMPPDFGKLESSLWAVIETVDVAMFGTVCGVVFAFPLAILAAANVTPARPLYLAARSLIGVTRVVPDLVWALLFVTAVGLGPFPGALALAVHSVGMLGRLFSEVIEDMDMGPVEALTLTGASRLQVFTHAVVPGVLPSLLGITLYRFDENLRSSLVLGFVGAGGIGFHLLTAMNLFQYQTVSLLLIITFFLVTGAEHLSAYLRGKVT